MGITHVIRGDDHLSNTPKQRLLARALGLTPPQFAHLPLILGPDRSRLSKRHGATAIAEYRRAGYLADALVNFIALLGWSPGNDQELLTRAALVAAFDLPRVGRTGAIFNLEKLNWMNGEYLKRLPPELIVGLWMPLLAEQREWPAAGASGSPTTALGPAAGASGSPTTALWPAGVTRETLEPVLRLFHGRVHSLNDFVVQAGSFFTPEVTMDPAAAAQRLAGPGVAERLQQFADRLQRVEPWEHPAIETCCRQLAHELGLKAAEIIHPTRVAVTGRSVGPSLFHALAVIGQATTLRRLRQPARLGAAPPS